MLIPTLLVAAGLQCHATMNPRCRLRGDVDGDGRADAVFIARRNACGFDVVVETRSRTLRAPVPEPRCRGKPSEFWPAIPRVIALRPMNGHRGLEPEVLTWMGASNYGVRFYTIFHGRLRLMRILPEPFPKDEWNVGGFAEAYSYHDCLRPHVVGVEGAYHDPPRWHAFGAVYRVRATAFIRVAFRRMTTRRDPVAHIWPYLRGDNFSRCGGVSR